MDDILSKEEVGELLDRDELEIIFDIEDDSVKQLGKGVNMTEFAKIVKEKYARKEEKPLYSKLINISSEDIKHLTDVHYSSVEKAEGAISVLTSAIKIRYRINEKEAEMYTGIYDGHIYVFDIYESAYNPECVFIRPMKLNVLRRISNVEILDGF